jgi:DNA-binding PadR family transcriptional regulator
MDRPRALERFLPLRPVEFHVLLSLAGGERHGYSMLHEMAARGETNPPDVGTLYRALRRLEDKGLIARVRRRDAEWEEERRNYFRILPLGLDVARAEARRLEKLLKAARAEGLLQVRPA